MVSIKNTGAKVPAAGMSETLQILLASSDMGRLALLAAGFWNLAEAELFRVKSVSEVSHILSSNTIELVVIDETLADISGLALAEQVAKNHPFVNSVLVSELPGSEFHERTEGLGVLMQLRTPLEEGQAGEVLDRLAHIRRDSSLAAETGRAE